MALFALVSFMAITLPLVQSNSIVASKSREAAEILVTVLVREGEGVGVASVRSYGL